MTSSSVPAGGPRPSDVHAPGFWPSWVGTDLVAGKSVSLADLRAQGGRLVWLEGRPQAGGRTVLVEQIPPHAPRDLTTADRDVGTRVHEYGGGAYALAPDGCPDGRIVFSDRREGGVWLIENGVTTRLGGSENCRYADFAFHPVDGSIFAVREQCGEGEPKASIVRLAPDVEQVLVEGGDFYAAPRPSPDGRHLAWIGWNHPDMPWDATRLYLAPLATSETGLTLGRMRILSGEGRACSVIEPTWQDATTLLANSDEHAAWRPYRFDEARDWEQRALPDPEGEIGLPHWVFGQRTLQPLSDGRLLALAIRNGLNVVLLLEGGAWHVQAFGVPTMVPEPFGDGFAWIDAPPNAPPAIVIGQPGGPVTTLRRAFTFPEGVGPRDCSLPEQFDFPTAGGEIAHALFYPPVNRDYALEEGARPPLVVMAHGGPTGRASPSFSFKVQWWTTRGFAVLDVNYRGSTGFGRAYRQKLDGQWGVVDVEDCVHAVEAVIARGLVDPGRCVIRGSSAGGLTVLQSLAQSNLFAAGASLYGVTDLRALADETHKFESRYLDRLIGPYPEEEARYIERSPLAHATKIRAPVLFLHGEDDTVVPLNQARDMFMLLRDSGRHPEFHVYQEEGHGFRQKTTLEDSFARELAFYQKVFRMQSR